MTTYPSLNRAALDRNDVDSYSQLVSAPGPFMEFGEFIYLEATSTDAIATLRISGKFLSPDGEIRAFTEDMTIAGTGTQTAVTSRIGPCWLMGFSVRVVSGTITDGEIVASVHIARASSSTPVHVMTLASGEVTNTRALGLGAFLAQGSSSSTAPVPDIQTDLYLPAAGAEVTYTVPAGEVWEIMSLSMRLTTSATVATRIVNVVCLDGADRVARFGCASTQTASQVREYQASATGAVWLPGTGTEFVIAMSPIMLPEGYIIKTDTTAIQAGDQYSLVALTYRRYT